MRVASVIFAALLLQGCSDSAFFSELDDSAAPFCDSLHTIQAIEGAWQDRDGTLRLCLRGVPVGAFADSPEAAEFKEPILYGVRIPGDIVYRRVAISEWQSPIGVFVNIGGEYTNTGCSAPEPGDSPIHVIDRAPDRRDEADPTAAIFDIYEAKKAPRLWYPVRTIVFRRELAESKAPRMVRYRLRPQSGDPALPPNTDYLLVWDAVYFLAETDNPDANTDRRFRCLRRSPPARGPAPAAEPPISN